MAGAVYLLQPMTLEYGFLTTGSSGVNDGHYKVLTMGIVSTS